MTLHSGPDHVVSAGYDTKQPLLDDIESTSVDNGALPSYRLEEPDTELVVGGEKCKWFGGCRKWKEFRKRRGCCHAKDAEGKKKCCRGRRVLKFLLGLGLIIFAVKAFYCFRTFRAIRSLDCTPLESGALQETYVIPVESPSTRLVFHSSFASPDIQVVRDKSLPEGEIHVAIEGEVPAFRSKAEDDESDPRPLACVVSHPKFSGAAFVANKKDSPLPSLTSTIIRVPASFVAPSIKFLGSNEGPSNRKLRKIIKWWKHCHEDQAAVKQN
jgi:hypothetical protein